MDDDLFGLSCLGLFGLNRFCKSHTKTYLVEKFEEILEYWGIKKDVVVCILSDNAANIVSAIKECFGEAKHLPCFAHSINLVVERSLSERCIEEIISNVKKIVTFIRRKVNAVSELTKLQEQANIPPLKLIQWVKTRWNSVFYMVQRFLKLAEFVGNIIYNAHLKSTKKEKTEKTIPEMVSADGLDVCKDFLSLLSHFEEVTTDMSSESQITVSKVIPIVSILKQNVTESEVTTEQGRVLKNNLISELKTRFKDIEKNSVYAMSTLLDPRFKKILFENPQCINKAIAEIKRQANLIPDSSSEPQNIEPVAASSASSESTSKSKIWGKFQEILQNNSQNNTIAADIESQIAQYFSETNIGLHENVFDYWSNSPLSILKKVALKYLIIPATSVPSERLFSKAGQIKTLERNRLSDKHLGKFLFLNSYEWDLD